MPKEDEAAGQLQREEDGGSKCSRARNNKQKLLQEFVGQIGRRSVEALAALSVDFVRLSGQCIRGKDSM